MKKRPTISRLDGGAQAILLVENVARTARFYQEDLRLEVKDGDGVRYVELVTDDNATLLIVQREGSIAPLVSVAAAGAPATLTFAITADAYGRWKQWLTKRGVEIAQEIKWAHGGRSLYVLDPDGHRIEFKSPSAGGNQPPTVAAAVVAPAVPPASDSKPAPVAPPAPAVPAENVAAKPVEKERSKSVPAPASSGPGPVAPPARDGKSSAPAIQGVLETALYVGDLARALAFYREVVGLKPMHGDAVRFQAFDVGPGRVLLLFKRGATLESVPAPLGMIPPHDGAGPQHIAFGIEVGDYNAWRTHLRAHGVAIESETGWDLGGRSIYFRDPDHHLVELATPGIWPNF